jgi:phosphomethylpyrimidine synthase
MKISQEVREFARLNPPRNGEGDQPQDGGGALPQLDADQGMAEMSKRFHDEGGELYVPAAERPNHGETQ